MDLEALLADQQPICWNEGSRFVYTESGETTLLFIDGEQFILRGDARQLAPLLCAGRYPDMKQLAPLLADLTLRKLVLHLFNQGSLYAPRT